MIENFEQYTEDLTTEEMRLIPKVLECFEENIGQSLIAEKVSELLLHGYGFDVPAIKVRQLMSKIRKMEIVWRGKILIGTGRGYHFTGDVAQIESYIRSLEQRIESIKKLIKVSNDHMNTINTNK
jgi:hypothetical protein